MKFGPMLRGNDIICTRFYPPPGSRNLLAPSPLCPHRPKHPHQKRETLQAGSARFPARNESRSFYPLRVDTGLAVHALQCLLLHEKKQHKAGKNDRLDAERTGSLAAARLFFPAPSRGRTD
jgi:hypothetical protein